MNTLRYKQILILNSQHSLHAQVIEMETKMEEKLTPEPEPEPEKGCNVL
jgi:hypothetical protein